jgi:Flp pilus assembly protein CpaB
MRRGRLLILLALVLIVGALAVYLVLGNAGDSNGDTSGDTPEATIPDQEFIILAALDIPRGSLITADELVQSLFPSDLITDTMITDLSLAVGQIARMEINRGIPLTSNMITDQAGDLVEVGSETSLSIPPGYTAIAIPMNRLSGVAYALRTGDKVDVLFSILVVSLDDRFQTVLPNLAGTLVSAGNPIGSPPIYLTASNNQQTAELGRVETEPVTGQLLYLMPQGVQRPRMVTQRLIENATVLHIGTFPLESDLAGAEIAQPQGVGAPAAQPGQETQAAPDPPDVVTLIVTPQDALALNWALKARADLMLTLRGPGDDTLTETTSVTLQYLLEEYSIAVPTSLPYGPEPAVLLPTNPVLQNDIAEQ